jgi:hypothetical protein
MKRAMFKKPVYLALFVLINLGFLLTAYEGQTQGVITLPQTGQTKCYDIKGVEINCAGTGQDGELQEGVEWPVPRFIVNGDCVTDNLTGLMWAKNGNLPIGGLTWWDTLDSVTSLNNGAGLCGYNDWRLPNVNELESLVNAEESNTASWLNSQGFTNLRSSCYWSSTTCRTISDRAYTVDMWDGYVVTGDKNYKVCRGLPVRSGQLNDPDFQYPANIWKTGAWVQYYEGDDGHLQRGVAWPKPRFTDHADGTASDNLTGLVWTKNGFAPGPISCSPATDKTWQEALDYVACLNANNYLGFSNWRLPNRKELFSLIDHSAYECPLLPWHHPFTNIVSAYWSSTTGAGQLQEAWFVTMCNDGSISHWDKGNRLNVSAWPVRSSPLVHYLATIQKTYIGYYQRPADPGGLIYWAERLDATGGNLTEIIEAFANSAESQALYGTINSSNISTVVNGIYNALFGRNAEAGGLDYYVNAFKAGQFPDGRPCTAATIMLDILYGATQGVDLQSVNNKVTASNLFTRTIDPDLDGVNPQATYAGDADAQKARDFLSTVGWDPTTVPTQDEITAYIQAFIADPNDILAPTALLRDDFDGSIVTASNWHIPTWVSPTDGTFVGQTQFRCSQNAPLPAASNSNAIIALDTYNPTGSSFYGTDLISNQSFALGQGITVTVRVKMNAPIPAGIVCGIFLYAPPASTSNTLHDEIDFELLSNDPNHVWTNIYGNEPLGAGHAASHSYATGSATDYHTYQIQWLPDQVSWYVDGTLVRTVTTQSPIPTGPMYVHLNIWVPGSDFSAAYDPNLHWTSLPSSSKTLSMSVDSVTVW